MSLSTLSLQLSTCSAATTIDAANHLAYAANLGWISLGTGGPKVDLYSGKMSGCVWSANCGWISLSNAAAYVQTDTIRQGTLAPNGLPVAWLLANFGTTNLDVNADPDHDGLSSRQEYLAGTNPNDANDVLRITSFQRGLTSDPAWIGLQWTAKATRFYAVQGCSALGGANAWSDLLVFPWAGANNATFDDANALRFYRLRAFRPLMP